MDIKQFKKWLIDNGLEEDDLFSEALKCYQIEAYKASFLYSYLGFVNFIKEIILNYKGVPEKIKAVNGNDAEKNWKNKIKGLDSEDQWETKTFTFIVMGTEKNIFLLKDSIRNEFIQKKGLRNVCAHNKQRKIAINTVEDLWDFIEYSKPYFVINGTVKMLKDQFAKIIKFIEKEKYEEKVEEIYQYYIQLQTTDKKEFFAYITEYIEEAISFAELDNLECVDILLGKIFRQISPEEYKWINNNELELYFRLNIDNYKKALDIQQMREFAYYNSNQFTYILVCFGNDKSNRTIMRQIYIDSQKETWWRILANLAGHQYEFDLDEDLIEIIKDEEIDWIFNDYINPLYHYKTREGRKKQTDTFDYTYFENRQGYIKIILLLIKLGIVNSENGNELLKRCKKLISLDYNDESICSNYYKMYEFLTRDVPLFKWLQDKQL